MVGIGIWNGRMPQGYACRKSPRFSDGQGPLEKRNSWRIPLQVIPYPCDIQKRLTYQRTYVISCLYELVSLPLCSARRPLGNYLAATIHTFRTWGKRKRSQHWHAGTVPLILKLYFDAVSASPCGLNDKLCSWWLFPIPWWLPLDQQRLWLQPAQRCLPAFSMNLRLPWKACLQTC